MQLKSKYLGRIYNDFRVTGVLDAGFGHKRFVLEKMGTASDRRVLLFVRDNTLTKLSRGMTTISDICKYSKREFNIRGFRVYA